MSDREQLPSVLKQATLPANGRFAQFEATRLLGQGGMGIVVAAIDHQLHREVAIKLMRPELARSAAAREMFLTEARAMAALRHDNIVPVYEVGEVRQVPFLAMELLEGETIHSLLARGFEFSDQQIAKLGYQVAAGLHAAHKEGIIHRDIKPGNVFLELPRGRVKVLDFGLARSAKVSDVADSLLVGTPGYLSPEQARDDKIDMRSDLFSLGVVLYRMASGRLPWNANDSAEMLVKLLTEKPMPLKQSRPDLPSELTEVVDRCLASRPADRPASAAEVGRALKAAHGMIANEQDDAIPLIVPQTSVAETLKHRQRTIGKRGGNKLSLQLGLAAIGVSLLIGTAFWLGRGNTSTKNTVATANTTSTESSDADHAEAIGSGTPIEQTERVPAQRPSNNIPDGFDDSQIFDNMDSNGADCYVTEGLETDVGREPYLFVAGKRDQPGQNSYLRFDVSDRDTTREIDHVYLLMTLVTTDGQDRSELRFKVGGLRDAVKANATWMESGPRRIVYDDQPMKVRSADVTDAAIMSVQHSSWYDHDHDPWILLQHRTKGMVDTIREDTDGIVTFVISAEKGSCPQAKFVSRDGSKNYGPKLVIAYKE